MQMVPQWSGREVRALREARRMSVREFAAHLGVSDRMVSKWEAGGDAIRPRPLNQAVLDTSLQLASAEEKDRFLIMAARYTVRVPRQLAGAGVRHVVRLPVDGGLMTLVEAGPLHLEGADRGVWLPAFYIDVEPVTNARYAQFLADTGHPPPLSWPDGTVPEPLLDEAVRVGLSQARAYAAWAGKIVPTEPQWVRATRGDEGVTPPRGPEWRGTDRAGGADRPFRGVVAADEMLEVLVI